LQRFDPTTGEFTSYRHDPARPGLASDWVNTVMVDRSGTVWAGTQAGLNRLDPRTGAFTAFGEREGLSNSTVTGILEDGNDNLWLSTNNGLNKFDPRTRSARDFYRSDGISANEFNRYGTPFKSATGEMFFGSYGGLTAFFPDHIPERGIPGLVLTDFQVNGKPVPIGPDSPLSQSISYVRSITLDHTQDMLSIGFAALAFAGQEGIRFRYRLRDVDTEWFLTDATRPFASYTNLSHGSYVFQVQVTNVAGVWRQPERELRIRVLPPWWSTWWFRASVLVGVVAVLWMVYQLRVQQLAKQFNWILQARVSERARIAREIHDTLLQSFQGLVLRFQSASNLLPARPVEAKERLDGALDQAQAAIVEGRDAVQGLRSSAFTVNDLANGIAVIGAELTSDPSAANAPAIDVEVEGATRDLNPVVREEAYRVAREALRNAFSHAQARRITVTLEFDARQFRLSVRDDGKGMDEETIRRKQGTGHFGLASMHERAANVRGQLHVHSAIGFGTEIELRVPRATAYSASGRTSLWSRVFGQQTVTRDPGE
jgi:signal transduction histidine kinase